MAYQKQFRLGELMFATHVKDLALSRALHPQRVGLAGVKDFRLFNKDHL